ncbi:phosphorylase family protein [Sulfurospirillum cavolei]|uniref:phosphorylase family protein n=1 Tax=Sulfurospirillum cavolei TaxID=366522 RepID=UPI003FA2851E
MQIHTLIHTALVAEAKPIIGHFKLTCKAKQPFNLYENENVALIVSGMGSQNAKEALAYALSLYEPRVAINIGIAGCSDTTVAKGTLFCTTHEGLDIPFATCSSRPKAVDDTLHVTTTLVDMEADTFLQTVPKTVETYVFKIVSDHLETSVPSKADVGNWIGKSIKQWEKYVRRSKSAF